jgi:hypothetical protein
MPRRKSQLLPDAGEFAEAPAPKPKREPKPKEAPPLVLTADLLSEEQEQADLVKRCADHEPEYPELKMLYHIANGGWRGMRAGLRMKAAGVKKGVPDLCLPIMRFRPDGSGIYPGLYIEMKRTKRGVVSKEQRIWIRRLRRCGYAVAVCKGMEIAWTLIIWYLSLERVPIPVATEN